MEKQKRPLIIGAGAAGLMAALVAARRGRRPIVIDRNPKPGRKLAATGNGRGNYTNAIINAERYHSSTPGALKQIFAGHGSEWAIKLFAELGITPVEEQDGRVFPASQTASSLVDVLVREILDNEGEILLDTHINEIRSDKEGFKLLSDIAQWLTDRVLVSTGGEAYPQLGSSGAAYGWLNRMSIRTVPLYPVLVPLVLGDGLQHKLQGVKVLCELILDVGGKAKHRSSGEMLFTAYGVSGPAAMGLSGYLSMLRTEDYQIIMDLRPEVSWEETKEEITQRLSINSKRNLTNTLVGLLPHRLIPQLLIRAGFDPDRTANTISKNEREALVQMLKRFPLKVKGVRSWTDAQVTGGGVCLDQVDVRTFECRNVPGLFLAGELMDVWGDSGGYNLHFAWVSGFRAGSVL